ncbi:MAG: DUF3048 domain-containing protein, partial [bacterium]|nr:DUF3048 domain-containing protein [bacterium]
MFRRIVTTVRSLFGRAQQRPWITIGITLAIIGGGVLVYAVMRDRTPRGGDSASSSTEVLTHVATTPSWLDGTPLPEGTPQPVAVAVVIDNAPEAQPQSGLAVAPLVFEVPVEGRRTRFLAVYALGTSVERIGPVRSARPYVVGLADALAAPLVHVGGSPAALTLLRSRRHINQYYDPPFVRDHSRPAPFNVFTSLGDLASFVEARGWEVAHPRLWPFSETVPNALTTSDGGSIRIPFSGHESSYVVEWKYDEVTGVYSRRRGGAVLRDVDGATVTATNVVVLSVRSRVLDAIGRLAIPVLEPPIVASFDGFTHAARATVFRDGQRIDGGWSWEDAPSDGGRFGLRQGRDTE